MELVAPDDGEAQDEADWAEALGAAEASEGHGSGDQTKATTDTDMPEDDLVCKPCGVDEGDAELWEQSPIAQKAKSLPDIRIPSREEVAKPNLAHLPYRGWCVWCQAARRPNVSHHGLPRSRAAHRCSCLITDLCGMQVIKI